MISLFLFECIPTTLNANQPSQHLVLSQIMYMEGFKFSLLHTEPCLNLFLPSWTLDTVTKFHLAMVAVFAVSFLLEGLSAWRYRIVKSVQRHQQSSSGILSTTFGLRLVVTLMHGLQGLLGYLVMLAVMTYSLELLLTVVAGLALGYAVFFQYEEALARVHVTTNPCCSFLKGEARETIRMQVRDNHNNDHDDENDDDDDEEQEENNDDSNSERGVLIAEAVTPTETPRETA